MSPCTGTGGKVTPTRVPLGVGQGVVVRGTQVLDARPPLLLCVRVRTLAARLVYVEVQVPELELGLRRRTHCREHDVPATRRPTNRVTCAVGERAWGSQ